MIRRLRLISVLNITMMSDVEKGAKITDKFLKSQKVQTPPKMMIEIKHQPSGQILKVNAFWLRDHCRCVECYSVKTRQRKYNLLDLKANVKPDELEFVENEGRQELKVKWNDGHSSNYDIDFIYESQVEQKIVHSQNSTLRTPWNDAIIRKNESHLRVTLPELVVSDEKTKQLVSGLIRYGICFIDEVPPTTTMTEMAVRRVFPVMKTFFGEMFTFTDAPDHADTAYSKEYLGPHTDNTYFCDAAGLQTLHCLEHINGEGGENFFIDGLYAALELKRCHRRAFEVLSTVQVPAEYIEQGQNHYYAAPMIRVDPVTQQIIQIRLNVYDRAIFDSVPQDQMEEFYESFRQFLQIVQSKDSRWTFKLQPGTVVVFDNWRVFHARHSYTGLRSMTGCYVQRTDFLSKARLLGIIDTNFK